MTLWSEGVGSPEIMVVVSRNASTGDAPAAGPELVEVASAME